jgi:hypothetical protein
VILRGEGSAADFFVRYLAGAGVGRIAVPAGRSALYDGRNPDVSLADGEPSDADLAVVFGPVPFALPVARVFFWGRAAGERLLYARLPGERACVGCIGAATHGLAGPDEPPAQAFLGALVATEALRVLLGITEVTDAILGRFDLASGTSSSEPFPFRPGCTRCG